MIVADERVARYVSEKVGHSIIPPYTCMGIEKDGSIKAGVVFNCWEGADIHVTVAGDRFGKTFIKAVGEYVFNALKCERITVTTEHQKVVDYAMRLGGQIEGKLRNHFGKGRDGIIVGILKEDYAL